MQSEKPQAPPPNYRVKLDGLSDLSVLVYAESDKAACEKVSALGLAPWSASSSYEPEEFYGGDYQKVAPDVYIRRGGGLLEPLLKLFGVAAWKP